MASKVDKILVSLDCILDTRIGTLRRIDEELAKRVMLSDTYHTRDVDAFEHITKDAFKEAYAKRDEDTLTLSLLTNMHSLLKHFIGVLLKENLQKPYYDGVEIVVNLYPYMLSKDVQDEIRKSISVLVNELAEVTLIDYGLDQLSPYHCKSNYRMMIMYDYNEWLNYNAALFAGTQMPEVSLFVPALYFAEKPTDEKLKELCKDNAHPFEAIEMITAPLIDISLIDVSHFSIINTKD